jgi:hypothetical protein
MCVDANAIQAVKFGSLILQSINGGIMRFFELFLFVTLLVASVVAAASFDAPKRKSGRWEVKISIESRGGPITERWYRKSDVIATGHRASRHRELVDRSRKANQLEPVNTVLSSLLDAGISGGVDRGIARVHAG